MIRYKLFIILGFITMFFTTCKKYPEGGYERRGPKVLIKNTSWTLTLYEVNGIDSTDLINYNGDENYKRVTFYKEGSKYSNTLYGENFKGFSYIINFSNNNTKLEFKSSSSEYANQIKYCFVNNSHATGCYRLFFNPEGHSTIWDVIKLTKKELILTCSQLNQYKLKFKCG